MTAAVAAVLLAAGCSAPLIPPRPDQLPAACSPSRTEPASSSDEVHVHLLSFNLSDSGAHPVDLDPRDQLDYVFYRSSPSVDIEPIDAGSEDTCLRGLSDHLGIRVMLRVAGTHRTGRATTRSAAVESNPSRRPSCEFGS